MWHRDLSSFTTAQQESRIEREPTERTCANGIVMRKVTILTFHGIGPLPRTIRIAAEDPVNWVRLCTARGDRCPSRIRCRGTFRRRSATAFGECLPGSIRTTCGSPTRSAVALGGLENDLNRLRDEYGVETSRWNLE